MKDTNFIIVSAIFVLILVSLLTNYNGTTDVNEYTSVAKFFAGEYNAKVRSAHSLTYGFINAPLLKISENFYNMKLISLILIIIIIFSIYFISGKDKKALILISISPIIFYMGPWINPIQLSSLLFLWGFFFIRKFELNPKNIYLIYSGILIGLSWVFWNTVLFILPFFVICFFFNKRFSQLILFSLALLAGLLPLLIFDYYYFTTPFYSIFRHLMANVSTFLYGRIYSGIDNQVSISAYIAFFIMLPLFGYTFFKKQFFKENNSVIIFITLVILFFLTNPQIRYLLFIWPILILTLSKSLNDKQLKIQIILFIIISLIVITPYVIQLKYSTNSEELTNLLINFGNWKLYNDPNKSINQEIIEIAKEYPNSTFLVGNNADGKRHQGICKYSRL